MGWQEIEETLKQTGASFLQLHQAALEFARSENHRATEVKLIKDMQGLHYRELVNLAHQQKKQKCVPQ